HALHQDPRRSRRWWQEAVSPEGHRSCSSGLDPRSSVRRWRNRARPAAARLPQRTNKKMKAAALRGALSDRVRTGRLHVVDALVSGDVPSTKAAVAAVRELTPRPRVLVVVDREDIVTAKS